MFCFESHSPLMYVLLVITSGQRKKCTVLSTIGETIGSTASTFLGIRSRYRSVSDLDTENFATSILSVSRRRVRRRRSFENLSVSRGRARRWRNFAKFLGIETPSTETEDFRKISRYREAEQGGGGISQNFSASRRRALGPRIFAKSLGIERPSKEVEDFRKISRHRAAERGDRNVFRKPSSSR